MQQEEIIIKNSNDLYDLIDTNKIVVLKFSASWCGPCQNSNFKNMYNSLKNNFKNNVKFYELDVDKDEEIINDKTYYEVNVKSVPYFLIAYDKNFEYEFSGTNCINDINNIIIKYLSK